MLASSFSGQDIIGRLSRSSEGLIDLLRRWDRDGSGKATRDDFWRAMRTLDLSAGDGEIDWAYTYLADDNDDQLVDVFTLAEKLQPNAVQRAAKLLLHEAEGTDLDLSSRSKTWVDLVPPRKEAVAPPGEGALQAPAHPSDLGMAGDAANGEALPQREPVGWHLARRRWRGTCGGRGRAHGRTDGGTARWRARPAREMPRGCPRAHEQRAVQAKL